MHPHHGVKQDFPVADHEGIGARHRAGLSWVRDPVFVTHVAIGAYLRLERRRGSLAIALREERFESMAKRDFPLHRLFRRDQDRVVGIITQDAFQIVLRENREVMRHHLLGCSRVRRILRTH